MASSDGRAAHKRASGWRRRLFRLLRAARRGRSRQLFANIRQSSTPIVIQSMLRPTLKPKRRPWPSSAGFMPTAPALPLGGLRPRQTSSPGRLLQIKLSGEYAAVMLPSENLVGVRPPAGAVHLFRRDLPPGSTLLLANRTWKPPRAATFRRRWLDAARSCSPGRALDCRWASPPSTQWRHDLALLLAVAGGRVIDQRVLRTPGGWCSLLGVAWWSTA